MKNFLYALLLGCIFSFFACNGQSHEAATEGGHTEADAVVPEAGLAPVAVRRAEEVW